MLSNLQVKYLERAKEKHDVKTYKLIVEVEELKANLREKQQYLEELQAELLNRFSHK